MSAYGCSVALPVNRKFGFSEVRCKYVINVYDNTFMYWQIKLKLINVFKGQEAMKHTFIYLLLRG